MHKCQAPGEQLDVKLADFSSNYIWLEFNYVLIIFFHYLLLVHGIISKLTKKASHVSGLLTPSFEPLCQQVFPHLVPYRRKTICKSFLPIFKIRFIALKYCFKPVNRLNLPKLKWWVIIACSSSQITAKIMKIRRELSCDSMCASLMKINQNSKLLVGSIYEMAFLSLQIRGSSLPHPWN